MGGIKALSAGVFSCDTPPAGIISVHPPSRVSNLFFQCGYFRSSWRQNVSEWIFWWTF